MITEKNHPIQLMREILNIKNLLIVQDIDGVCIPLVKDPLKREIEVSYIYSARKLRNEFAVLTNGEHEGPRGLKRVIERAFEKDQISCHENQYLPGLAAGGVEYQDRYGQVNYPGVSNEELVFLKNIPQKMEELLKYKLNQILPSLKSLEIEKLSKASIIDTKFSPTINLNQIFSLIPNNIKLQQSIQLMLEELMNELMNCASLAGLSNSFYLHVAPNLGKEKDKELIKFSSKGDVGTTDIQLMLSGAIKEAGLLVLINKYVEEKYGKAPFGKNFNVREAPRTLPELLSLCREQVDEAQMPVLIGIGDTVTSTYSSERQEWLRGGSDRGFLTLIQELGKQFKKENKVVLVDSSGGEVDRPSLSQKNLNGITDPEDPLKFNALFKDGPNSYVEWFCRLAEKRVM